MADADRGLSLSRSVGEAVTKMNAAAHRTLEALFDEGVALATSERAEWLARLCIDEQTRRMLAGMLEADATDDSITGRVGTALATAWYAITPGARLGRYRVLRELGRGGSGVVYLAERADDHFDQQVAIKLIGGIAGAEAARQLRHERQLLATLDHPYIARLLDGGETAAGHPYLVMEYVRGAPIAIACRQHALPVAARAELVMQIAQAVHYAHQRLVVHRDIKPGNVMLRDDGRPVLLDFGIAKLLGADSRGTTQPWFTPAYASPEQRRGEPVSTASDIYALGVLLFELLTDRPPEANQRLPRASDVAERGRRAELRGDLDAIIRQACANDPRDRYASARSMADDLERYLRGHPVRATRHSTAYLLRKLVRRRPLEALVLCGFILALSLVGWRLADQRNRALVAEAAAIAHARDTEAVTEFIINLLRQAEPQAAGQPAMSADELIDLGRQRLQHRDDLAPPLRARLAGTLGGIYRNFGQPAKASAILGTAVEAAERAGAPAADRADYLRLLADALEQRGRLAEAERHYASVIRLMQPYADAALRVSDHARLGRVQSRWRRFVEAESTLRDAIGVAHATLGPRHPRTAEAQLQLARMHALAERPRIARALIDDPIASLHAALSPGDPALLAAMTLQAGVLRVVGEAAAAERVLLAAMAQPGSLQAGDSGLVAAIHDELGRVHHDQGRLAEAAEQFRAALALARQMLAPDDPALAIRLHALASLYEAQGAYASAEPLLREALVAVEGETGEYALQRARLRQDLGRLLLLAGRRDESHPWLAHPIEPRNDPQFRLQQARQRLHLAEWHRRFGDRAETERLLDALDANIADLGGPDHPRHAFALRVRAGLVSANGELDRARALLMQALAINDRARGEHDVGHGLIALELAQLELLAGRPEAARDRLRDAIRVLDGLLAADAPQRADWLALARRLDATR